MRSIKLLSLSLILSLVAGLSLQMGIKTVEVRKAPGDWPFAGDYYLVCIAIDDYVHWPKLNTSVADAEALAKVLVERYGFAPQRVVKLYNAQATERGIMRALHNLAGQLRPEDWLLISYAGHGVVDDLTKMGAWVPVNARKDDESQWVDNGWIKAILKLIRARHVLLICDSCFTGDDPHEVGGSLEIGPASKRQAFRRISREVIVSGGPAPVRKKSLSHSVFGHSLLRTLRDNKQPYFLASDLHEGIKRHIGADKAEQTQLSVIQGTGSQLGGSFVFVRGLQKELDELDRMIEKKQRQLTELQQRQAQIDALNNERRARLNQKRGKLAELDEKIDELAKKLTGSSPNSSRVWTEPNTGMQFVWIPSGCFDMGSPLGDNARDDDEGPVHEVCLDGFWIGKFEVTNAQYRTFRPKHHSGSYEGFSRNGADQPVVYVSWDNAKAFADHLSAQHAGDFEFRLPTEAEWEFACRAGTTTRYHWGDEIDARYVNLADKSHPTHPKHSVLDDGYPVTAPVGSLESNAFDLHDMAGNVVEWCYDWYAADAYQEHSRNNPMGPLTGTRRVMRGGSYWAWAWNCRSADRGCDLPQKRRSALGFRLVMKEKK